MKLLSNTWNGYTRLKWTKAETTSYLLRRFSEKTKIAYPFFEKRLRKAKHQSVMRFFDPAEKCFNFNGAKIPDISQHPTHMDALRHVFEDVFLFHCHYGENYQKELVETLDKSMVEGPYGYIDGAFDVTVKPGDIVIDARCMDRRLQRLCSLQTSHKLCFRTNRQYLHLALRNSPPE